MSQNNRTLLIVLCLIGGLLLPRRAEAASPPAADGGLQLRESKPATPPPFFQLRKRTVIPSGPGRQTEPTTAGDQLLLAYFGPTRKNSWAADMWRAAQLAVDQANAQGGYQGKPFRLVPVWSDNPWGTGVGKLARMVYEDHILAIIGGVDGPSTHLAEQVVAKACLPLISPASSDKTTNLANVPWFFSLLPGDHLQAPPLARYVSEHFAEERVLVLSCTDHDCELFIRELVAHLRRQQVVPRFHFRFRAQSTTDVHLREELLAAVAARRPDLLILAADAEQMAALLVGLRRIGCRCAVVACAAAGQNLFLQRAGKAAEGVVCPLLWCPEGCNHGFVREFSGRFGYQPDYLAAYTYDAVTMLIAAVKKAGPSRAQVAHALRALSPWQGASGTISWDPLGANTRKVRLGVIRNGRIVPLDRTGDDH